MNPGKKVAIVNYGAGNLFSVAQACRTVGLEPVVTDSPSDLKRADAVILPGVGAFGQAMDRLTRSGLADAIAAYHVTGRPLVGICLGMQLFMDQSDEFGTHRGLGLIQGCVRKLPSGLGVRVPNIGWRTIRPPAGVSWRNTLLEGLKPGDYQYLIHSYYVEPVNLENILSLTDFGPLTYASALRNGNLYAFQYHPEKSGPAGLAIYKSLANQLD